MIFSMTGYGEAEIKTKNFTASFNINALNSRFLDVKFNTPRFFASYENEFFKILKSYIKRGKIEVYLNFNITNKNHLINFDENIIKHFINSTKQISKKYNVPVQINMSDIFSLKGVFNYSEIQLSKTDVDILKNLFHKALKNIIKMRKKEGRFIENDIKKRLKELQNLIGYIKRNRKKLEKEYKEKIINKAKLLKKEVVLDENRLMSEIAILLTKNDITEEITRFESHIKQFFSFFKESKPIGKKMDFLCQEILRETNTIGSKINNNNITNTIINIKDYIEQIREQVQNIE